LRYSPTATFLSELSLEIGRGRPGYSARWGVAMRTTYQPGNGLTDRLIESHRRLKNPLDDRGGSGQLVEQFDILDVMGG
jgi:hypothetical protein